MLNEEIVKEMSKYDDMFNGFSYNDIIQEKFEDDEDKDEENPQAENNADAVQDEGEGQEDSSDDSDNEIANLGEVMNNPELGLKQKKREATSPTGTNGKSDHKASDGDAFEMQELSPDLGNASKETDQSQPTESQPQISPVASPEVTEGHSEDKAKLST